MGLPPCELNKLRVQNAAARLVTMAFKSLSYSSSQGAGLPEKYDGGSESLAEA